MKTKLLITLTIGLLVLSCKPKKSESRVGIENADQLINNYYVAIGGYDKLKSIQTKIVNGHYIEPGYDLLLDAHLEYKRPNYRIIGDTAKGYAEGFDGSSWEYSKTKGYYRSEGEASKATKRGSEFDESFIDYQEKGYEAHYVGITKLQNTNYHELDILFQDGDIKKYFFDADSYLLRYMSKTMPLHAKGEPIDFLVSFSDYRMVDGLMVAFSLIERDINSGKMINCTLYDSVIFNVDIPLSRFSPI